MDDAGQSCPMAPMTLREVMAFVRNNSSAPGLSCYSCKIPRSTPGLHPTDPITGVTHKSSGEGDCRSYTFPRIALIIFTWMLADPSVRAQYTGAPPFHFDTVDANAVGGWLIEPALIKNSNITNLQLLIIAHPFVFGHEFHSTPHDLFHLRNYHGHSLRTFKTLKLGLEFCRSESGFAKEYRTSVGQAAREASVILPTNWLSDSPQPILLDDEPSNPIRLSPPNVENPFLYAATGAAYETLGDNPTPSPARPYPPSSRHPSSSRPSAPTTAKRFKPYERPSKATNHAAPSLPPPYSPPKSSTTTTTTAAPPVIQFTINNITNIINPHPTNTPPPPARRFIPPGFLFGSVPPRMPLRGNKNENSTMQEEDST